MPANASYCAEIANCKLFTSSSIVTHFSFPTLPYVFSKILSAIQLSLTLTVKEAPLAAIQWQQKKNGEEERNRANWLVIHHVDGELN